MFGSALALAAEIAKMNYENETRNFFASKKNFAKAYNKKKKVNRNRLSKRTKMKHRK